VDDALRRPVKTDGATSGNCRRLNEFFDFRPQELRLIEALRALRILHHCAWLGRRWDDPVFPHHFPWFNTARYWGEHILFLREQIAALAEPPLQLP
jgi:Ser/Thr protein kinase RdoA (MazF antagonist)